MSLKGKTAIVTGSNSGIGLGIATELAKAGADVVLNSFTDRDEDHALAAKIAEDHGVFARYIKADMSKGAECRALIEEAGTCDILVNNAGIQHVSPIDEFPMDKWDAIIAINMNSAFHTTAAALPKMREKGWGRVINIASAHGLTASPYKAAYVSAKHGVVGMTKVVALETAREPITANAVCPGYVLTPLVEAADPRHHEGIQHGPRRGDREGHAAAPAVARIRHGRTARRYLRLPRLRRRGPDHRDDDQRRRGVGRRSDGGRPMALRINLALQGGGAHGAFTWGVLDRLLDEDDIEIAAISGTSAGALNGAAYKSGIIGNGREGARANLEWLWNKVAAAGDLRLTHWINTLNPSTAMISQAIEASLPFSMLETASRVTSPYWLGPFYRNPLEPIVSSFAYDKICAHSDPAFFVSATNVRTGKIRVFEYEEISTDAILASACLPTMFQAVELDDPKTGRREAFWDGGYTGNPALFPLFPDRFPDDIVVVNINPLERFDLPTSPQDILNRINEVSFNSSLLRELRAITFVKDLIAEGKVQRGAMKDVLVHMIADDDLMRDLSVATKLTPTAPLLQRLREAGHRAADRFLADHKDKIGKETSVDLRAMFG